jgi:hypothetical protein
MTSEHGMKRKRRESSLSFFNRGQETPSSLEKRNCFIVVGN